MRSICTLMLGSLMLCSQVTGESSPTVPVDSLKTFGTSGKAVYPFPEGDKTEAALYEYDGAGCLTHMWFGGNWPNWERIRIRVYVDGEESASIDMEMYLGHGIGFKDATAPWGTRRMGKTGQPSGVYNTFKIPFGKSVRVTAQLHESDTGNKRFWYIIRGVENLPFVIATSGMGRPDATGVAGGLGKNIEPAQIAAAKKYKHCTAVPTRHFQRHKPGRQKSHWHNSAESYCLVGDASARAMIKILESR